jgi:hypothetical protein
VQGGGTATAGGSETKLRDLFMNLKRYCLGLNAGEQIVARPPTQFPDSTLAEQLDSFTHCLPRLSCSAL